MTSAELREFLIEDKPWELNIEGNKAMFGSIVDISDLERDQHESVVIRQHGRYLSTPEHGHDFYEMMYVYEGSIRQRICTDEIVLKRGYVCLMNKRAKHSIDRCGKTDITLNFLLSKKLINADFLSRIEGNLLFTDFFYKPSAQGEYILIDTGNSDVVRNLTELAACEYFDPNICSQKTIESIMSVYFNELYHIWRSKGAKEQRGDEDEVVNINRILRYIRTNCAKATLTSTAQRFGYAPNYLSKLLWKGTGMRFKEIQQRARLEQATMMLINSDMAIAEIAHAIGFTNISFFYSLFNRHFIMTPNEYRQVNKKNAAER
jgi:AraC-like DNA-binding protein/mannose-6-phosphate isomerase-like protein (cupin superfamily)